MRTHALPLKIHSSLQLIGIGLLITSWYIPVLATPGIVIKQVDNPTQDIQQASADLAQAINANLTGYGLDYPVTQDSIAGEVSAGFVAQSIQDAIHSTLYEDAKVFITGLNVQVSVAPRPVFANPEYGADSSDRLFLNTEYLPPDKETVIQSAIHSVFKPVVSVNVQISTLGTGTIEVSDYPGIPSKMQMVPVWIPGPIVWTPDVIMEGKGRAHGHFFSSDLQQIFVAAPGPINYQQLCIKIIRIARSLNLYMQDFKQIPNGYRVDSQPVGSHDDEWFYQTYTEINMTDPNPDTAEKGHQAKLEVLRYQLRRKGESQWVKRTEVDGPFENTLLNELEAHLRRGE